MLIAFTYLPGFVTMVFRGMPTVWRGRHRLIFCWLIFMQAVSPGRKTLEEMARWTPSTITAWRFGRLPLQRHLIHSLDSLCSRPL
jgi:hypothetical protein